MSKETHTPTPWLMEQDGSFNIVSYNGRARQAIKTIFNNNPYNDKKEANAEFVLKAVNNHDRLVEALDTLVNTPIDGSGNHFDAWHKAQQLLTELKS